jgi:hypothetical protein
MRRILTILIGITFLFLNAAQAQVDVTSTGGTATATYATVSAAFDAVNAGTHTGDITLGISANTTEPATITPLYASGVGTTSYTSLTIRPTVSGVTISSDASPTSGKGILEFIGADNITIDGSVTTGGTSQDLTILLNGTATTPAAAIRFAGGTAAIALGCNNVTIKNCVIKGSVNTASGGLGHFGIACTTGYTSTTNSGTFSSSGTGADYDNFTIQNNNFQTLSRGISFAGTTANPGDYLKILNNQMNTGGAYVTERCIFVAGTYGTGSSASTSALIEGNDISSVSGLSVNPSVVEIGTNNQGLTFSKNKIHDCNNTNTFGYGIYAINITSAATNSGITIVNNMIWNISAYGYNLGTSDWPNAIRITSAATGIKIYHNTIAMNGTSTVASRQAGIYISSTTATLDIRNNVIAMTSTGTGTRAAIWHAGGTLANIFAPGLNNNVYYAANGTNAVASNAGTNYASFTAWRTATGRDANSYNEDPILISGTDMHADANSGAMESRGASLGVTTDIDGDARNATTPDIGADEYVANLCSGTPAIPTHPASLVNLCPNTTTVLSVTGANTLGVGVTYQWEESNDNGVTDPWANAVAGSGATTTSYTTAPFFGAGSPPTIYYRLKTTCASSTLTSESAGVQLITQGPTTQASSIVSTFVNSDLLSVSFTAGNGSRRAVYVNNSPTFTAPVNGVGVGIANSIWQNLGQQLVADGAVTTATVTSLSANTQYYFAVYEYNQCTAAPNNFFSTALGIDNPKDFTTCAPDVAPTVAQGFSTFVPSCWRRATGTLTANSTLTGTAVGGWSAEPGFGNTGTNPAVRINLYSTKNDWFISPSIDLGATPGVYRLKYNMAVTSFFGTTAQTTLGTHKVDVVISTDGGLTWSNANILKTYTGAATYSNTGQIETIDLTAYSGVVKIAFVATTSSTSTDIDFHVDDFVVETIPTCFEPTVLTVPSLTANTADLSWSAPTSGTSVGYNWIVVIAGAGSAGSPVASGSSTTTTANATGLTDNTSYEYWVQTDCGSGATSAWSGPKVFKTPCLPVNAFPWTENFDAITIPSFPNCWTKENGDWLTTNNANSTNDADGRSGTQFLRNAWSATNEYMWTPGFQLTAGTSYDFSFFWAGDGFSGWAGDVFYNTLASSNGATQLGTSFVVAGTTTTKNYEKVKNSFVPTTTGTYYFAIRVNEATGAPWYLSFDDFSLDLSPTCVDPSALTIAALTSNSADLSWTAPVTGSPLGYNWVVVAAGAGSGGAPIASGNSTTTTANATGLTDNTNYEYWVQSDCGSSTTSAWAGPKTFKTPCIPLSTFPWTENFDALTAGTNIFPSCWDYSNTSSTWSIATFPSSNSGANSLRRTWSTDGWAFTPSMTLTAGTSYDLSYYVRTNDNTVGYDITVGVGTAQNAAAMTTTLSTVTGYQNPVYEKKTYSFIPTTTGVYSFGIRVVAGFAPNGINFDDFKVDVSPSCIEPTALIASNVTTTSATVSWTASVSNPTDGYEYEVRESGAPGSGAAGLAASGATLAGVTSVNVTGLLVDKDYSAYVRSNCGTGVFSAWSTAAKFQTGHCRPISSNGCTDGDVIGQVILNTLDNNTGTANCPQPASSTHYTIFPATGNLTTTLNAGTTYPCTVFVGQYTESVAVWIDFNDNLVYETSERIGFATGILGSGVVGQLGSSATFPVSLPCNPPVGDHRMRVRCAYATAGNAIDPCNAITYSETEDYIVTVAPPPPCPSPSALTVTNINPTGADYGWTIGCTETQWDLYVVPTGTATPTPTSTPTLAGVSSTNYSATGLTPKTGYDIYVRAVCDPTMGVFSSWVGPVTFTTPDVPPANDNPCGAFDLAIGAQFCQNTSAATVGTEESTSNLQTLFNAYSTLNNTVWFKYTPTTTDIFELTMSSPSTSTQVKDTWCGIYTLSGNCPGGVLTFTQVMAPVSNFGTGAGGAVVTTTPTLTAGTTYYFVVDGYAGLFGDFCILLNDFTPKLNSRVFLNNVNPTTGLMDNYVSTLANFPLSDPYAVTGAFNSNYTHVNNPTPATTTAAVIAATGNNAIVDWVFVELRQGTSGSTTVSRTITGLLQADGDIVDTDGVSPLKLSGLTPSSYYVAIRHRNHLGFRTNVPIFISSNPVLLDFSTNSIPLFGATPNTSVTPTIFTMIGGDSNSDGSIDAFDTIIWEQQNGLFDDYTNNAEYNMDGSVDALDTIIWEIHNGKFQELD